MICSVLCTFSQLHRVKLSDTPVLSVCRGVLGSNLGEGESEGHKAFDILMHHVDGFTTKVSQVAHGQVSHWSLWSNGCVCVCVCVSCLVVSGSLQPHRL